MPILSKIFKLLAIISAVIGVLSLIPCPEAICALILPFPSRINQVTIWPLLFLFILAPSFVILMSLTSFREKHMVGRFISIIVILLLIFPIIIIGEMFFRRFQPQRLIYKPTVINEENLRVYKECILYAQKHDEDKKLVFHNGDRVVVRGQFYMLSGNRMEQAYVRKTFSEEEISEMKAVCKKLFNIRCVRFQRYNDFLIFYKAAHTSQPEGPGVVYSLDGFNPNEVDYEILNENKPFVRIAGNWYTSRSLMLKGPRCRIQHSLRRSVFESSLKIDENIRELLENDQL